MVLSLTSTLWIAATLAVCVGSIVAGLWLARRRHATRLREQHLPLVVLPVLGTGDVARPVMRVARQAVTPPSEQALSLEPKLAVSLPQPSAVSHGVERAGESLTLPPPPARRLGRLTAVRGSGAGHIARSSAVPDESAATAHEHATLVDGHSIRFYRPADGTLQFHPGRLKVIAGRDAGHEIRFVKTYGPDANTITFGRLEGPPYRHIQLREATVSRQHARLELARGSWHLVNLSGTNPVVVNGVALEGSGTSVPLQNDDRVEMGEVVFRFIA
ncbi:MAG: FHA domain-containing protein [Gemmatimonadaceae bacterium]